MSAKSLPAKTKSNFLKMAAYCAYQERCHTEVNDKLQELGIFGEEAGEIISELIAQNYLNEERFAKLFAGGKFRIKKWGRLKIKRELQIRNISDYCIQEALKEILESDYRNTMCKLIAEKWDSIKLKDNYQRKKKVAVFMQGKGYEGNLVWEILQQQNQ